MPTEGPSCSIRRRSDEGGAAVIIVMMFVLIMLGLGAALFLLVRSSIAGTELERREVKAFNVAEAGVDAGLLALKLDWPRRSSEYATVDVSQIRSQFPTDQFPDPQRSSPSEWLQVALYDNSEGSPLYDAGGPDGFPDDRMVVDSEANVDDDRHRILVVAQRENWPLEFPLIAMYAGAAGGNAHGLRVAVDPAQTAPVPPGGVPAYWGVTVDKGVQSSVDIRREPGTTTSFANWVTSALWGQLTQISQDRGTFFDVDGGTPYPSIADGTNYLLSAAAPGSIICMRSNTPIVIASNVQIGTPENPVVLVLDTPDGTNNVLDFRGAANFFGVLLVRGNLEVRGTSGFYGSVLCSGFVNASGIGTIPEVNYNEDILKTLFDYYTLSVAIVPNTWEEYTIPRSTTGGTVTPTTVATTIDTTVDTVVGPSTPPPAQ